MSQGDVFVTFGADSGPLEAAVAAVRQDMEALRGSMGQLAAGMQEASRAAEENLGKGLATVNRGLSESVAAHKEAAAAIQHTGEAAKLGEISLGELKSSFLKLAEVAGISFSAKALEDWVKQTIKAGDELDQEAARYGVSLQTIQQLHGIASIGGAEGSELVSSLRSLQSQLKLSSDDAEKTAGAFKAIGISFDEMKGKSPLQLLEAIAGGFARYQDGVNKSAVANELLGESGIKLIRILDEGRAGFQEIEDAVLRAGNSMSDATIEALARTERDLRALKLAWNSTVYAGIVPAVDVGVVAMTRLVEAINPVRIKEALQDIADGFIDFGGKIAEALARAEGAWNEFLAKIDQSKPGAQGAAKNFSDKALDVLNDLASNGGDKYLTPALNDMGAKLSSAMEKIGLSSKQTTEQWRQMADASRAASQAGQAALAGLGVESDETRTKIAKIREETEKIRATFDALTGASRRPHSDAAIGGTSYYGDAAVRPGSPNGPQAGSFGAAADDDSKGTRDNIFGKVEADFSGEVTKAQQAAQEIADAQNGLLQRHQITMSEWLAASLHALDAEQDAIQDAGDRAIATEGLNAAQRTKIEDESAARLKEIAHQVAEDQNKAAEEYQKSWQSAAQTIETSFNSQLRGLLAGTESWASAGKKILGDFIIEGIEGFEKLAINALLSYSLINQGATASAAIRTAADQTAAAGGIAALVANAFKAITVDAAQTAAGVSAWLAPFIGPAAPAAGAAAGAAVMGMGGIGMADVGMWSVPSDMLTMIHKNELVATPAQADAIRSVPEILAGMNAAPSNGPGGSAAGGLGDLHFHINAIDSGGIRSLFENNGDHILRTINNSIKNGGHLKFDKLR